MSIAAEMSMFPSNVRFKDLGAALERAIWTTGLFAFGTGAQNPRSGTVVRVSGRCLTGAVVAGRCTGRGGGGGRDTAGAPEGLSPAALTGRKLRRRLIISRC